MVRKDPERRRDVATSKKRFRDGLPPRSHVLAWNLMRGHVHPRFPLVPRSFGRPAWMRPRLEGPLVERQEIHTSIPERTESHYRVFSAGSDAPPAGLRFRSRRDSSFCAADPRGHSRADHPGDRAVRDGSHAENARNPSSREHRQDPGRHVDPRAAGQSRAARPTRRSAARAESWSAGPDSSAVAIGFAGGPAYNAFDIYQGSIFD